MAAKSASDRADADSMRAKLDKLLEASANEDQ